MTFRRDDIERVRTATNLIELVQTVTTVRRTGKSYMAICPFHQEKTPSLSLDPAKAVWYCHGCHQGGDVFKFLMDTKGLDFNDAVEELASQAGITLERDPGEKRRRSDRDRLVEAMTAAVDFYHRRLHDGVDAGKARAYLRGRGYDADTVEHYRVGWAPAAQGTDWDVLVRDLGGRGVSDRAMLDAGLAARGRNGRLRDWFHGRVLFPIHDLRGDPVGFGGRLLEGEGPKYLNTPETKLYQKARLLYGLDKAKAPITRASRSVVVEGYTDVIACHRNGIPEAVATCGTALGEEHIDLLRRFADRVVLAFDADQAGAGAALRGGQLKSPFEMGLDLRVAMMPAGSDPADLAQDGRLVELKQAVDTAVPLVRFRIDRMLESFDLDEPEGRARAVKEVAPLLAEQGDPIAREEYIRHVSRRTGTDQLLVGRAVLDAAGRGQRTAPVAPLEPRRSGQERAERELLRLLVANPEPMAMIEVSADWFASDEHLAALARLAPAIAEGAEPGHPLDMGSLLGDDDSSVAELLRSLAVDDRPLDDPGEVVASLRAWAMERRIADLRRRLERVEPVDGDTHSRLLTELIALEQSRRALRGGLK